MMACQRQHGQILLDLRLHRFAGPIRRLFVRHLNDLQLTVPAQALGIFRDGVLKELFLDLSDCDQCDLHDF